jgi:hypothetical protein
MMRVFHASMMVVLVLAAALAGCAAGPLADQLPGDMGLPKDAPARPIAPYQFPAVHDMPPPRATRPLNDEEQFKLEKELGAVRDRQQAEEGQTGSKASKGKKVQKTPEAPVSQAAPDKIVVPPTRQKAAPQPEKLPAKLPNNAILVPPAGVKTNP